MEPSDGHLVALVVAERDARAFDTLVTRHQARVRNWLRQLTRDAARADDLAQDTFIRAWDRIGSLQNPAKFSSWLMKIAYTSFLQAHRKHASEQRLVEALQHESSTPEAHELNGSVVDLPRLLSVLSSDERTAMILCYAHDLSHSEIAEITDWPLGTVKSHIARGKAKIRGRFDLDHEP
jgi:RNA polymerase sigma-70 factor (ECF subfamily)